MIYRQRIMNTYLKNIGIGLWMSLVLIGCQSTPELDRPLVEEKYSLKSDRDQIESLRKEIPSATQLENDEWALILKNMASGTKPPSEVREQFYSQVRKQKEKFNRDLSKEREKFTKEERKTRAEFLKNLDQKRKSYLSDKPNREQRAAFISEIDSERTEFMQTQKDRRADFEADTRERRKNFEDYIKERTSTFDQELKAYRKRLSDIEAEKKKAKP